MKTFGQNQGHLVLTSKDTPVSGPWSKLGALSAKIFAGTRGLVNSKSMDVIQAKHNISYIICYNLLITFFPQSGLSVLWPCLPPRNSLCLLSPSSGRTVDLVFGLVSPN